MADGQIRLKPIWHSRRINHCESEVDVSRKYSAHKAIEIV